MPLPPKPTTEGNFRKTPLANVLLYARERKMTGSFVITVPTEGDNAITSDVAGVSTLVLEGGSIAAVQLPRVTDTLSWVLREMDLITDDVFVAAQEEGADEIATLLRLRAVDPVKLDRGLRELTRRKVASLFGVSSGTYAYYSGVDVLDGEGHVRTPEDVLPIVWKGFRAHPPDDLTLQPVLDKIGRRAIKLREGHEFDRFDFGEELGLAATQLRNAASSMEQLQGLSPDPSMVRVMVYLLALTKQIEAINVTPTPLVPSGAHETAKPSEPARPPVKNTDPPRSGLTSQPAPATSTNPPMGASNPPPAEGAEVRAAQTHLKKMENWTYFEMFDLNASATTDDVRAKFPRVAAEWHPDRAKDNAARLLYAEIFSYYNTAFATLTDQKLRDAYEETVVGGGGTPAAQKQVAAVLDTVQEAHRAEILIKRKEFTEAETLLRRVLDVNPDDVAANLLLVQCLLETNPAPHYDDMIGKLAKVIKATENNERALFLMGTVLKRKGDRRWLGFYKQVLDANPNHVEASREFRLAQQRAYAKQEEQKSVSKKITGFFDKMFKK